VCSHSKGVKMFNLIWFVFGFVVGLFSNLIIGIIKYSLYMNSKKAKRKAFKKRMDDLYRD